MMALEILHTFSVFLVMAVVVVALHEKREH